MLPEARHYVMKLLRHNQNYDFIDTSVGTIKIEGVAWLIIAPGVDIRLATFPDIES